MHRSLSGSIAAWNGPESKVSEAAIVKGANLCYMGADLDDAVSAWDDCEKNEDYDAWDWKEEVKKFSEVQRRNLYIRVLWLGKSIHVTNLIRKLIPMTKYLTLIF